MGKTHLAKSALWVAAQEGIRGFYLTMARFDRDAKDFEARPEVRERRRQGLSTIPLLVIDDVGSTANRVSASGIREGSAFVREQLSEMFDMRYRNQAPTLLTTNLTHEELAAEVGVRSWDRLKEHGALVYVPGVSMRGQT